MAIEFVPRLEKPEDGNPFYNTKSKGGYSSAIIGYPTDPGCNVLSNCVGFVFGRFNEISNNTSMSYLAPRNAEVFWDIAGQQGLERGNTPRIGAVIVWQRGDTRNPDGKDGAGHVAIVEQVISDTEIVTSESGYGSTRPFWTTHRKLGSGNWGMSSNYKFIGFIYHPDIKDNGDEQTVHEYMKIQDKTPVYDFSGKTPVLKPGVVVSPTGVYTIVSKKEYTLEDGKIEKYGKLKSGIGWVLMETLYTEYILGDKCEGVHIMKTYLAAHGYLPNTCVDDKFDKYTQCAICGFQFDNNLKITGTYNSDTRKKLESGA
jgi:surface antigen